MKLSRSILPLALLAVLVAPAAHAEIAIDSIADSDVSFEGLIQADGNWYKNDVADLNAPNVNNGQNSEFEMRRAELVLKGKGPGNYEWVFGYDAKLNKFLDVNAKYKIGGDANQFFQLGQFKQPNSMEELSSTKNNDFVAKAAITNTFGISRRLGAAYNYGTNDWGVTVSAFGRELTRKLAHGNGYGARGYWAPINQKGNILHFGLSYVDYDTSHDTLRYRARPDADLATVRLVDTGSLTDTDRVGTLGFESLWVHGPFKVQGEYMTSKVTRYRAPAQDFTGTGGYVSGVWNITGETWGYKSGTPTTPLPDAPASGMWQVGLRYDTLDLNNSGVFGGKMNTVTAGVNWYLRSNFKLMLNYVKVNSDKFNTTTKLNVSDNPDIIEARAQFYF
jgi:phosphate-selective porin OprO/OprP